MAHIPFRTGTQYGRCALAFSIALLLVAAGFCFLSAAPALAEWCSRLVEFTLRIGSGGL